MIFDVDETTEQTMSSCDTISVASEELGHLHHPGSTLITSQPRTCAVYWVPPEFLLYLYILQVPFEKRCRKNDSCIAELEVDFRFM